MKIVSTILQLLNVLVLLAVLAGGYMLCLQVSEIKHDWDEMSMWRSKVDNRFRLFEQYDGGRAYAGGALPKFSIEGNDE